MCQKVDRQIHMTANVAFKIKSQSRELNSAASILICCQTGPLPCQLIIWDVPAQSSQGLQLQAQIFKTSYIPYLWTDTLWSAKPVTLSSSLFSSFTKLLIKLCFPTGLWRDVIPGAIPSRLFSMLISETDKNQIYSIAVFSWESLSFCRKAQPHSIKIKLNNTSSHPLGENILHLSID